MRSLIHSPLQNEMHPQPVDSTLDETFDGTYHGYCFKSIFLLSNYDTIYVMPYSGMNIAMSIQYAYILLCV